MAPHRVLQLITRAEWGGAQRHVFDLATRLDPDEFQVTVASAPEGPLVERLRLAGVQVLPVRSFRREIDLTHDLAALKEIVHLVRSTGAHLVHAHSSKAGLLGRLAARWCGVPAVYTAHGFAFGGQASGRASRMGYLAAEWLGGRCWSDRIITVSQADHQLAMAYRLAPENRLVVVHNGIDPEPLASVPLRDPSGDAPVVGTISRLVQGKGLEDLLLAAQALIRQRPCRIMIAGDGPLYTQLNLQAEKLGIADHVRFVGFVEQLEVFLSQLDVFVLPSYKEGLPYTVLEALASGRPVVATAIGGLPEVISDGVNGRLVPVGDVAALTQAIQQQLDAPDRRALAERARQSVMERFHVVRMLERIRDVYRSLLKEG